MHFVFVNVWKLTNGANGFKKTTVVSVLDAVFTFFKFKIVSVFSLSIVQTIEQPLQHK